MTAALSKAQLVQKFRLLGIQAGDLLLTHSSFKSFGPVEGGPQTVLNALFEVLTPTGTLVMPTFNFAFCEGETYDYRNTPSKMGTLTELVRKDPEAKHIRHPIYSFAMKGALAEKLSEIQNISAYGHDSLFAALRENNGKILILGLSYTDSMTFFHHVEEMAGCDYRYMKTFTGKVVDERGNESTKSYQMNVRDSENGVISDLDPMGKKLEDAGLVKQRTIGKCAAKLMNAREVFEATKDAPRKHPDLLRRIEKFMSDETTLKKLETYFDRLWPICRSITGEGFRKSLDIIAEVMPTERLKFPSGTKVFDWTVPKEWNVNDAYIIDPNGKKRASFKENNLHLLGYSVPFKDKMPFEELKEHLYSLPNQPTAVPYLTSYYKERWGFCLTDQELQSLPKGTYEVFIDSELKEGRVEIGEAVLPGESKEEILLSTYFCHPSMANNELSGPLVVAFLYDLLKKKKRRFTYRFVISAETIGTISYLSMRGEHLKKHMLAGYQVTCIGDEGPFTYKKSRRENSLADFAALKVLKKRGEHRVFAFDPADGSDERQYCSPGWNLPHGSLMRTMYAQYPEYHTSLDVKGLVTMKALAESISVYEKVIDELERSKIFKRTAPHCEPQLGKRGLYPNLGSQKEIERQIRAIMWALNYSDGEHSLDMIAEKSSASAVQISVAELESAVEKLMTAGLLEARA